MRPRSNSPLKHLSTIQRAVCTSRAAKTSSRSRISAFEYTARARVMRAFWPPESVRPFSPTSVMSPASNSVRSRLSAHW